MENLKPFPNFATDVIHVGQEPEQWTSHAVVPPISPATTFQQAAPGEHYGYEYTRAGNPTRTSLEKGLAAAEGARYGLCFASGLAAEVSIAHLLKSGDHIICMDDVYGGTNRYFNKCAANLGLKISMADMTKVQNVVDAVTPETRMIWVESPTNPTLKLVDIAGVCQAVKDVTKDRPESDRPFVVVDNTFESSYFQRPLSLGADMVFHSITKYMNGHCDVLMGAIMLNDEGFKDRLVFMQLGIATMFENCEAHIQVIRSKIAFNYALGAVPSPFDCFLVNRGLKTLPVRMKEHMKNGLAVAKFLEGHPAVEKVVHPGLPSHPQYELGKRQMIGYSGMVVFFIKGTLTEAKAFFKNVKVFILAESLGGVESLCELPSLQTHASVPEDQRKALGITDTMVRLSVGLEDAEDLIKDLDQALRAAVKC